MLERKSVTIGGILVSYLFGGNSGTPLIFLHGWGSEAALWKDIPEQFSRTGFLIYVLDLPGFGRSENFLQPSSLSDYVALVEAFMQKFDIQNAVIVGHSFGGSIGILLAATRPRLVSKLILVDAAGIRNQSRRVFLKMLVKALKPFFAFRFMQPLRRCIYTTIGSNYLFAPDLQQTFAKVLEEDLSPLLPKITQKTLLFWGGKDTDTPLSYAQTMKKTIPHATLTIVPEAGHFSFLDAPDRFLAELKSFIA